MLSAGRDEWGKPTEKKTCVCTWQVILFLSEVKEIG